MPLLIIFAGALALAGILGSRLRAPLEVYRGDFQGFGGRINRAYIVRGYNGFREKIMMNQTETETETVSSQGLWGSECRSRLLNQNAALGAFYAAATRARRE